MKRKKLYRRKMWAGFVDGRLHLRLFDTGFGGSEDIERFAKMPAIYPGRAKARKHYEDVRPVEVRELP